MSGTEPEVIRTRDGEEKMGVKWQKQGLPSTCKNKPDSIRTDWNSGQSFTTSKYPNTKVGQSAESADIKQNTPYSEVREA